MSSIDMLEEMSKFTFSSRYARYIPEKRRRENWNESVDRSLNMHIKKYSAKLSQEDQNKIKWAFSLVHDKRVAGSMRAQQFAGPAIEAHNAKIYNCVARHVDSIRAFSELFYLAMNGCGTTFGLSRYFVGRLPDLVDASDKNGMVLNYPIKDTIEGWSDSIEALLSCYFRNTAFTGMKFSPDYSRIRKKGTPLKTTGGKAPGHEGLKAAHKKIKELLDHIIEINGQKRLKTSNVCDILCHCMDAVLSGGIRRSAAAGIFDLEDEDMMNYKVGNWFAENPQRARVNISALVMRDLITYEDFRKIFEKTKQFGEPGFIFANDAWQLFNPCFEINFIPVKHGVCGAQFCNLSTINGAKVDSVQSFQECVEAATIIGTLQAGYTDFPYLSQVAKQLTEDEALLGVSITGMMNNSAILLDPEVQAYMSKFAVQVNKEWAAKIGIKQAARVTCLKPEGTTSLIFKSSSGIHAQHAREFWRRIQCNKLCNVYQYFKSINPHLCEPCSWSANNTDDVIAFPVVIDTNTITKDQLTPIHHLDLVKSTQLNWVNNGVTESNTKNITHNVSCTIEVDKDQWDEVAEYLYENRYNFAAVSLIAKTGDKDYKQAPNERVANEEDRKKFDAELANFLPVDYSQLVELEDGTALQMESSCAGGRCELPNK